MCGCLVLFIGAAFPRVALFLLELFSDYNETAFDSFWEGFLGFLFLPTTTLAFAFATTTLAPAGEVGPFGWLITIVALLIDVGLVGGGGRAARRRRDDDD